MASSLLDKPFPPPVPVPRLRRSGSFSDSRGARREASQKALLQASEARQAAAEEEEARARKEAEDAALLQCKGFCFVFVTNLNLQKGL